MDLCGVIVKRRLSGLPLTLSLPFSAFAGVTVRLNADKTGEFVACVELSHRDPALSLPLVVTRDMEAAALDWKLWSDRLGLPMLLDDGAGRDVTVFDPVDLGKGPPMPRRRMAALTGRRPRFLVRRQTGVSGDMPVLRGCREIISYE